MATRQMMAMMTLVLLPWVIMYTTSVGRVEMMDWDMVFNTTVLEEYPKVITMNQFMEMVDQIWPVEKSVSFCYTARNGKQENACNAKDP